MDFSFLPLVKCPGTVRRRRLKISIQIKQLIDTYDLCSGFGVVFLIISMYKPPNLSNNITDESHAFLTLPSWNWSLTDGLTVSIQADFYFSFPAC